MEITTKTNVKLEDGTTEERGVTNTYPIPETLDAAVEELGAELVYSYFANTAVLRIQGIVRTALGKGKTADEIQAILDEHKLGIVNRTPGLSSLKAVVAKVKKGKMTKEELMALLEAQLESDE